jgi:hypothetical protein
VGEALFLATIMGTFYDSLQMIIVEYSFASISQGFIGMALLCVNPGFALSSVLAKDAGAMKFAKPYLAIRALTFVPSLLATVGFASFR